VTAATPPPITTVERQTRIDALCAAMRKRKLAAILLGATSSLRYYTGVDWHPSERLLGAVLRAEGDIVYIAPRFELEKVSSLIALPGDIRTWEEHENPYALVAAILGARGRLGVDERIALFMFHALRKELGSARLVDAGPLIHAQRARKSPGEIALMQHAKTITLGVHKRAWEYLHEGVKASDVARFVDAEHRASGGDGNAFCIVSFGPDTSLPHGGETDRALREGDVVLIDIGTRIDGYHSDITRTYVYGAIGSDVADIWALEKEAQAAAFGAAQLGQTCESVDAAARAVIERAGLGPDYRLPGLPHRTGHGIGLDVHEAPNLVRGDATKLQIGMCFSNEPMIVVPGRFGVRLEDHFHMTPEGPRWFTTPQPSLEAPFAD